MSTSQDLTQAVTGPELDVSGKDNITTASQFSGAMTLDLTDDQIAAAFRIVSGTKRKFQARFFAKFKDPQSFGKVSTALDEAMKLVDEFEDELKTRLAEEVGVLASVDMVPILEGQPISIEWLGVLPGGNLDKYGMDHEKKMYEVRKATSRGEAFLGEKD